MRLAAALAAVLSAAPVPALGGPPRVEGDGRAVRQERRVPAFEAIRLEAAAELVVRVGAGPSVAVSIDGNLQPHLLTEVKGGTLVVRTDGRIRPKADVKVEVAVPELRRLHLEGAGDATVEGGSGPLDLLVEGSGDVRWRGEATTLRVSVEGAGDVSLEGRADLLRATIEGAGDVRAARLAAKDVEASVEGSGDIDLHVAGGRLVAAVEGSGDIRWRGEASVEQVVVSGSGAISRRE